MTVRDEHGQPLWQFPTGLIRNYGKAEDQLIGIARGIMCDDEVTDLEAAAFRRFVERLYSTHQTFPFDLLKERLDRIFADGRVDDDERLELRGILRSLGGLMDDPDVGLENVSCSFPLDEPPPGVTFFGREFVVTGRFAFGTRIRVHEAIERHSGRTHTGVRPETDFLVIGHFASRDWVHTSYGLKIERAVELRESGHPVAIISEAHWKQSIP